MASIVKELRRRHVFKVTLAYAALAWLLIQIGDTILPAFDAPGWVLRALIVFLAAGLPFVVVIAWVFEITPEGVRRTDDLPVGMPSTPQAGRKLDFVIIAFLSLALITVVIDQYVIDRGVVADFSTIAVLPLENLSGEPSQDYFVDGMTEAIISNLSKIGALRVLARNSVMRFKGSGRSLAAIAAELGADAVVTGSVIRQGEQVRITAQLVEAATNTILWTEIFDGEFRDIFSMQSGIAAEIADQIEIEVSSDELARITDGANASSDGYDDYLKGMERFYRLTPSDLEVAIEYFDRALEQNPNSALALSGVAAAWVGLQQMGFVSSEIAAPNSEAALLRAIEIDAELAEAYQWLAVIRAGIDFDWQEAATLFERAIELDPNFADARISYAHFLTAHGQSTEGLEQSALAMELDPFNGWVIGVGGVIQYHNYRYGEAIALLERALQLSPDLPFVWLVLAGAYHQTDRFDDAYQADLSYLNALGLSAARAELMRIHEEDGYQATKRYMAELAARHAETVGAHAWWAAYRYAHVDDMEKVIEWLQRAYEQGDPSAIFLRLPEFYPLHDDPRVQDLMVKMGIQ